MLLYFYYTLLKNTPCALVKVQIDLISMALTSTWLALAVVVVAPSLAGLGEGLGSGLGTGLGAGLASGVTGLVWVSSMVLL